MVVEPAVTAVLPLSFCTASRVEHVVVSVGAALVRTETVPVVANQELTGRMVGVSKPFAPPVAVTDGLPALAL